MPISVQLFKMLETIDPGIRGVLLAILEEMEHQQKERVTKDEFVELKQIVAELATAQKRTEARVEELADAQRRTEARVEELAEAQKRTESRVEELAEAQKRTESRVEELAEAQKRTEARVEELAEAQKRTEARLEELAEAQTRTEARVEELAEAQKRTESRVEELAEAQKETEKEIKKLAKGLQETRRMVGGLSDTVGYGLEDRAIASMPRLLKQRYDIEIDGHLVRKYINFAGREQELNMFGTGTRNGKKLFIVGEGKAKLSKKHVDSFEKLLNRLRVASVVDGNVFPVMVTYTVRPDVEEYAASKGIYLIWSYDLNPY